MVGEPLKQVDRGRQPYGRDDDAVARVAADREQDRGEQAEADNG